MATQTEEERDRQIAKEQAAEAVKWLEKHRGKIPPPIRPEKGSKVELGEKGSGRVVPVVPLNEDRIGPINNPHPTKKGAETLLPWPGQGTKKTDSLRPTEDEALGEED